MLRAWPVDNFPQAAHSPCIWGFALAYLLSIDRNRPADGRQARVRPNSRALEQAHMPISARNLAQSAFLTRERCCGTATFSTRAVRAASHQTAHYCGISCASRQSPRHNTLFGRRNLFGTGYPEQPAAAKMSCMSALDGSGRQRRANRGSRRVWGSCSSGVR